MKKRRGWRQNRQRYKSVNRNVRGSGVVKGRRRRRREWTENRQMYLSMKRRVRGIGEGEGI